MTASYNCMVTCRRVYCMYQGIPKRNYIGGKTPEILANGRMKQSSGGSSGFYKTSLETNSSLGGSSQDL